MSRRLKATRVMVQPLKGDDVLSARQVLGPAIDELDRDAHDAGFRLRLIVIPSEAANPAYRRCNTLRREHPFALTRFARRPAPARRRVARV